LSNHVLFIADCRGFFACHFQQVRADGRIHPFWSRIQQRTEWNWYQMGDVPKISPPVMISPFVARCAAVIGSEMNTVDIPLNGQDDEGLTSSLVIGKVSTAPVGCITSGSGAFQIVRQHPTDPWEFNPRHYIALFTYFAGRSPHTDDFCSPSVVLELPKYVGKAPKHTIKVIACSEDAKRIAVVMDEAWMKNGTSLYVFTLSS
jgi:hypothetical protein